MSAADPVNVVAVDASTTVVESASRVFRVEAAIVVLLVETVTVPVVKPLSVTNSAEVTDPDTNKASLPSPVTSPF